MKGARTVFWILLILYVCGTSDGVFAQRFQHDVSADSITSACYGRNSPPRFPAWIPALVTVRMSNRGTSDESQVRVVLSITDQWGNVAFRDTMIVEQWPAGRVLDTIFAEFTPPYMAFFTITMRTELSGDEDQTNDVTSGLVMSYFLYNPGSWDVTNPAPGAEIVQGTLFQPAGRVFAAPSFWASQQVDADFEIRRWSDGHLEYRSTASLQAISGDSVPVPVSFPAVQGSYDVSKLPAGEYSATLITHGPHDADLSNDTSGSSFRIIASSSVIPDRETTAEIAPNPTKGWIEVRGAVRVRVSDVLGNKLIEADVRSDPKIDLTRYPAGVYNLTLETTNGPVIRRAIKQ